MGPVGAARYNTWLLIKSTPKGVVFSFRFVHGSSGTGTGVVCWSHKCEQDGTPCMPYKELLGLWQRLLKAMFEGGDCQSMLRVAGTCMC